MFIEGLKIIIQDEESPKLWRFRNDQGKHRNICLIQASHDEQQLIVGALQWLFGGKKPVRLRAAVAHISDADGDSWIIDRKVDQYRCYKNRQQIDGRPEVFLRALFKDFLPSSSAEMLSPADLVPEFEISFDGESILAKPRSAEKMRKSVMERQGGVRFESLSQSLKNHLTLDSMPRRHQIEQLLQYGEPILRKSYGIGQHLQEITGICQPLQLLDNSLCRQLEEELLKLGQIRDLAQPLFDPSKNPSIYLARLKEVDVELQQFIEAIGLRNLPDTNQKVDWSEVLEALTRYLAFDKLEKAARSTLDDARTLIKPAYEEYSRSVSQFLQIDRDLIRDLEACLAELGDQVRRVESDDSRHKDSIAGKLNKLLGWQAREGEQQGGDNPSAAQQLDLSRAVVNSCLSQLGRLYADLEQHAEIHEERLGTLEDRYEKVVIECGKAREQWLKICRQSGLPAETSLRSMIEFINGFNRIAILQQRRTKLTAELESYRAQIKLLGHALQDWRTHTGSQKSLGLDNSHLVLSEARSALKSIDKKQDQLQKMRAIDSKLETLNQLRDRLTQDYGQLSSRWHKLLSQLELPDRPLMHTEWAEIHSISIEWLSLERLLADGVKALKNEEIFGRENLDRPLLIYAWKQSRESNQARISLLQQIELADESGLVFLLTEDANLAEMIQKLEVSVGQKVVQKPQSPGATAQQPGKTIISERAKAALEIFAGKSEGLKRETF